MDTKFLTAMQAEYVVVDEGIHSLAEQMGVRSRDSQSPNAKPDEDFDIQSASEWPGVEAGRVLLSPVQCRQLWRQFTSDSAFIVQQAQATQVPSGSLLSYFIFGFPKDKIMPQVLSSQVQEDTNLLPV